MISRRKDANEERDARRSDSGPRTRDRHDRRRLHDRQGSLRSARVRAVVTVKGLAEREVPANLAMWPIVFSTTGNDLVAVQGTLDASAKKIFAFLERRGFAASDYSLSSPRVTDREAQGGRMRGEAGDRYVAEQTVTLRSGKIAAVKNTMRHSGELIRESVALMRSDEYTVPRVAAMLRGSHGMLRRGRLLPSGGVEPPLTCPIRNAQQGYFDISDRDPFSPEIKKIRVVTTVQYFLED